MEVTLRSCAGKCQTVVVDTPEFLIGRAEDCPLRLESPLVSRHHCALTIQNDRVYVRDLRSRNGTGVNNGPLVAEQPIRDGDTLWVAGTPIEVRIRHGSTAQVVQLLPTLGQVAPVMTNSRIS